MSDPSGVAALVAHVPAILWTAEANGRVSYVNQYGLDFMGRTIADVTNWDWVAVVHPHDLPRVGELWSNALESGEPYEIANMRFRRRDGEYFPFTGRALPERDAEGKIVRWVGCHLQNIGG